MSARLPRRHKARHARPRTSGGPVLAGLLSVTVVGGTGGLAAVSQPEARAQVQTALIVTAASALGPSPSTERVSRDRAPRAPVDAPAQVAVPAPIAPPPPAPAPPPPPPVLPGCEGSADTGYANGRLPESALCRLPGTRGHALRPDAARAFVQLSAAYEAERGTPVCVTDSYRSYSQQVALRRNKRGLAAPPGTSNHGDGVAIDMCGGVESFGTSAHRWMKANAGRFGWVHPSWAGPRGKRPEPWHWEYRP